jgi:thiamine-phosphate pyrophosphorylase
MRILPEFGFYGIISNPLVGYERLATIMVERGVRLIQLRMKKRPRDEVLSVAHSLRAIITPRSLFIVNDDPEIAKETAADGVHLGQDDMPVSLARQIVGPDAIIGLSTHDPLQERASCASDPDYIGVGPVFPTPTKEKPDPVIGLAGMREMLALATVPCVVLGGIDHSNLRQVLVAGARNVCAVRCINESSDPGKDLDRIISAIEEHRA